MPRLSPAILGACLLPLVLAACSDATPVSDPRLQPPLVRTALVESSAEPVRAFTGVVAARVQSDLGFRVAGKVLERLVDTGQTVKRGQLLMRLDPVDLGLQARAEQQAVASAQASARQTADDEARYRKLISTGAVSASTYDRIKAAADTAKAQLSAAEAQARVARNAMGYAQLVADADGVVVETLSEPGQVVAAGQAVVRLAKAGQREAIVHLPETLRPVVGSSAQATLYGGGAGAVPATLRLLSESADAGTRTFEARYVLQGALGNAPLGSTVTLSIPQASTPERMLQVPIAAVFAQGQGAGVWVVSASASAASASTVAWRPVQVHGLSDDLARITGQLQPGEEIVALGAHLLHDGEHVRSAAKTGDALAGSRP